MSPWLLVFFSIQLVELENNIFAESVFTVDLVQGLQREFPPEQVLTRTTATPQSTIKPTLAVVALTSGLSIYPSAENDQAEEEEEEDLKRDVKARRFIENQFGGRKPAKEKEGEKGDGGDAASLRVNAKLDLVHERSGQGESLEMGKGRGRVGRRNRRKNSKHLLFKFRDLPPWQDKKNKSGKEKADTTENSSPVVRLASFDPISYHVLAQSFSYPDSNSLSQSDREYFRMVRSENGFSDIRIVKKNDGEKDVEHRRRQSGQAKINQGEVAREKQQQKATSLSTVERSLSHFPSKPQNGEDAAKKSANESHSQLAEETQKLEEASIQAVLDNKSTMPPPSSQQPRATIPKFVYHRVSANHLFQQGHEDGGPVVKAVAAISLPSLSKVVRHV